MIKRILQDLQREQGVIFAGIASNEGLIIDYISNDEVDFEAVAAVTSSALATAENVGKELGRGDFIQAIVEYKGGFVFMTALTEKEYLVIVTDKNANLGKIRYEISKYKDKIKDLL